MKRAVLYGTGFSLIATVGVVIGKAGFISDNPVLAWLYLVVYYFVGGLGAGSLGGWMRPLSRWYFGRLLIAYVVILMAYGGGTIAFWPVLRRDGSVPLMGLLILWAILALPLDRSMWESAKGGRLSDDDIAPRGSSLTYCAERGVSWPVLANSLGRWRWWRVMQRSRV